MSDLDKLYSPSCWSKRLSRPEDVIQYHLKFIENASSHTTKNLQSDLNIPYGNTERQKIDIFGTDLSEDAPILIFIHGGYWQVKEITKSSYRFIAENLHKNKIKTVFIGYDLCPDVTMPQIIHQIEVATKKCLNYATKNKSKEVYFMGHSAGAHLVSLLFTNFINSLSEQERFIVKGAILTSGVFDLSLLQKTTVNEALKLDEGEAKELSPSMRDFFSGNGIAFHLFVGEEESPEFIRQSKEFGEKLKRLRVEVEFAVIAKVDHFDIIEKMAEEDFEMTQRLLKIIKKQ